MHGRRTDGKCRNGHVALRTGEKGLCVVCTKARRARFRQSVLGREISKRGSKKYRAANTKAWTERSVEWQKTNPEKVKLIRDRWRAANPGKVNASNNARYARKLHATPAWADLKRIEAIYEEANQKAKTDGMRYDVDHIVPLRGKKVCGLHVESNLQIILAIDNKRKNNRFEEAS